MKKLVLATFSLFAFCAVVAQAPQKFNYQAIARNTLGIELQNEAISVRISIIDLQPNGTVIYSERHNKVTNSFGLFDLRIGEGTVLSGAFANINWAVGDKYIKTEIDPSGGTNYQLAGTSPLISVPYALHAATADTALVSLSSGNGFNHYLGESFGGGIIFHLYKDANGAEHGLICAPTDAASLQPWSSVTNVAAGSTSEWNGQSNTTIAVAQPNVTTSAALDCNNYVSGGYTDWYLPSSLELRMLWTNLYHVQKAFDSDNDPNTTILQPAGYWSSTEVSAGAVINVVMDEATIFGAAKTTTSCYVRPIRAF